MGGRTLRTGATKIRSLIANGAVALLSSRETWWTEASPLVCHRNRGFAPQFAAHVAWPLRMVSCLPTMRSSRNPFSRGSWKSNSGVIQTSRPTDLRWTLFKEIGHEAVQAIDATCSFRYRRAGDEYHHIQPGGGPARDNKLRQQRRTCASGQHGCRIGCRAGSPVLRRASLLSCSAAHFEARTWLRALPHPVRCLTRPTRHAILSGRRFESSRAHPLFQTGPETLGFRRFDFPS